jgi:CDP-diacylglycerol--glycerol-3-phosphate 3-phosphatidyltransferase
MPVWTAVTLILMIAALVLTVLSGIDYIVAQVRGRRSAA